MFLFLKTSRPPQCQFLTPPLPPSLPPTPCRLLDAILIFNHKCHVWGLDWTKCRQLISFIIFFPCIYSFLYCNQFYFNIKKSWFIRYSTKDNRGTIWVIQLRSWKYCLVWYHPWNIWYLPLSKVLKTTNHIFHTTMLSML